MLRVLFTDKRDLLCYTGNMEREKPIHMNRNRILNLAIGRLLKQGAYGMTPPEAPSKCCQYINDQGNKCAVGILFSNEDARKMQSEGNASIDDLADEWSANLPRWVHENLSLLRSMQSCHDAAGVCGTDFTKMVLAMSGLS